ncbi:hypothetical protein SAMN05414139_07157 [Burkholderia sp. D7]|nr:hypothetical protein SAMN05414139_07157 [Burkholderia sp. D7]
MHNTSLPHPATIDRAGAVLTFTLNHAGTGNAVIGSRSARWHGEAAMPAARVLRIPDSATSPAHMANAPPTTQNLSTAKSRA